MIPSPSEVLSPTERQDINRLHSKFTPEEDNRLRALVQEIGMSNWTAIAEQMPGRNVRQCKERWINYLSPSLNTSPWTPDEDALLIAKQNELGSKWVQIARFFDNRTDAMCKNRFNVLRRRERKRNTKMLRDLALMQFQRMRKLPQAFVYQMCQMPAPIVAPPEPEVVAEPAPVFDLDSDDGFADFSPFGSDLWNETFDSDATLFEML